MKNEILEMIKNELSEIEFHNIPELNIILLKINSEVLNNKNLSQNWIIKNKIKILNQL